MSVFSDEWRDCLREQYKHVMRQDDQLTRRSLVKVMYQVGFSDDDLERLGVEATMRAEDMPDDYVPPQIMEAEPRFQPHPLECQCPECVNIDLVPHDDEGQPLDPDEIEDDQPRQLSMF